GARIGELVAGDTDPFSGQPEAKATPAAIAPVTFAYRGFALARRGDRLPTAAWTARVALRGGSGLLFASDDDLDLWLARGRALGDPEAELAEYLDRPRGTYRVASFVD